MADFGIFFGWGHVRAGREGAAGVVLGEAVDYWRSLAAAGTVESVEIVMLAAHGGDLDGFAILRGDREALARLRATPEFARVTSRAEAVADHVGVVDAYVDDGVGRMMGMWQEAIADLV